MSTHHEKTMRREARAFELFVKHNRLAMKHWRQWERARSALDRELEKWARSGRCVKCKGELDKAAR